VQLHFSHSFVCVILARFDDLRPYVMLRRGNVLLIGLDPKWHNNAKVFSKTNKVSVMD
jgi:hypothetical protein